MITLWGQIIVRDNVLRRILAASIIICLSYLYHYLYENECKSDYSL